MDHRTYSIIELVGVSEIATTTQRAVPLPAPATRSRGLAGFKVKELRGLIRNGEVAEYQVSLRTGLSPAA